MINHPPVANDDSATTDEDTSVTILVLANDTDPDGNLLTAVLISGPANGTLTVQDDGPFIYTPNANFHGTGTFTYRANDGTADSNIATVTITVTPVDDQPKLQIVKTGPANANVGDQITYVIQVSHAPGSDGSPVSNVTVVNNVAGTAIYVSGDDGDGLLEAGETWKYKASYTVQASDSDPLKNTACATGTDLDGDSVQACATHITHVIPNITINDVTVNEGDTATFEVSLSNPSSGTITVDYATSAGTALAGIDYTIATGTVIFLPGQISQSVTVSTIEDLIDELDETFNVGLTNASNATIADLQGVGTIIDDDGTPTISINDVTVNEGDTAAFTVSLSNPSSGTITVDYATSDGTALAGADYTTTASTVTFAPGTTSQTINVNTIEELIDEPDETFNVGLTNASNATIADPQGVGMILDDDAMPTISINDVTVAEGTAASFTVSLSVASGHEVTVVYATADGTALHPGDYTTAFGTVTFAPGVISQTITVSTIDGLAHEPNETFNVDLSAPGNATIADNQGVGTLIDNDGAPSLAINDVTVNEGGIATFTISLSNPSASTITVAYATVDGTALAGADYTTSSGTVTFAPGTTSSDFRAGFLAAFDQRVACLANHLDRVSAHADLLCLHCHSVCHCTED